MSDNLTEQSIFVMENYSLLEPIETHLRDIEGMGVETFSMDTAPIDEIVNLIENTSADYLVVHLIALGNEEELARIGETIIARHRDKPDKTVVTTNSGINDAYVSIVDKLMENGLKIISRAYQDGGARNYPNKIATALKQLN